MSQSITFVGEKDTEKPEEITTVNLEIRLAEAFNELRIKPQTQSKVLSLLQPLKEKDEVHHAQYEHCLRTGLLAKNIASYMHLDEKALLYAGLFHDLGKQEIQTELLGKTREWTPEDAQEIQKHVMSGYNLLKGKFDFSAEIILWHHKFQARGYPQEMPPLLHDYSNGSKVLITEYGRILALADVYDALHRELHREKDKLGEKSRPTDSEIEKEMIKLNPDRKQLVEDLYKAEIFMNADKVKETEAQSKLYEEVWGKERDYNRNPRETGR
jgi:putative nucleotidyltransferase with HDIG domain